MKWFEEAVADKMRAAKNHVILVPAQNPNAPIDTVDIFDGITGQFIVADVPEEAAREFVIIWNALQDSGDNTENMKKLNLSWLDTAVRKRYSN